jgi:signal transduction histidine kinase
LLVILIIGLPCLTRTAASSVEPPANILDSSASHSVFTEFLYLEDPGQRLSLQDVLRESSQGAFVQASPETLNLGYSESAFWIKILVRNESQETDWYIVAEAPLVSITAAYALPLGDGMEPVAAKPIENRQATRRFSIAPGTSSLLFLKVTSKSAILNRFDLYTEASLIQHDNAEKTLLDVLFGCFIAIIIYNLFLCVSLREKSYLAYLFFAIVNSHINLMAVNYSKNIWHLFGLDWWAFLDLYRPLAPFSAFVFTMSFLRTREKFPFLDKVLRGYMAGLLALMCLHLILPRALVGSLQNSYFSLGAFILMISGIYAYSKGFKPALFFLAGIGTFLLGMLAYLANLLGLVETNTFTTNALIIGHGFEMLLMSLALAGHIKMLQQDKSQAEIVAELKSQMLRVISHDIANPLTVVKGYASMLKDDASVETRSLTIQRAAAIIEDIINFVRKTESLNQKRKKGLQLESVSLQDVFDELAFVFEKRAAEKDIKLLFHLEQANLCVRAERVSLCNEVLGNLLSNAIKFSYPNSEIKISAAKAPFRKIAISVQDRGVGIAPDALRNLFDVTRNRSTPGTEGEKGTGYGMPLVQNFVEAFHGKLRVESITAAKDQSRSGTSVEILLEQVTEESDPAADSHEDLAFVAAQRALARQNLRDATDKIQPN